MSDPTNITNPMTVLLTQLQGQIAKQLISAEYTRVERVMPVFGKYNTEATVYEVDDNGSPVNSSRVVTYNRVDINDYFNAKNQTIDSNNTPVTILMDDTLDGTVTYPPLEQILDYLNKDGLNVDVSDFNPVEDQIIPTQSTWFGNVSNIVNCTISNSYVRYTNGDIPVLVKDYLGLSKTTFPVQYLRGLRFSHEWSQNKLVELTLPPIADTDDWQLFFEDVDGIPLDSAVRHLFKLEADKNTIAWRLTLDDQTSYLLDSTAPNVLSVSILDGILSVSGRNISGVVQNYVSAKTATLFDRILLRLTAFTNDPQYTSFEFKYTTKPNLTQPSSTALVNYVDYTNLGYKIEANPESTAVCSSVDKRVILSNKLCHNYRELPDGKYRYQPDIISNVGGVTQYLGFDSSTEESYFGDLRVFNLKEKLADGRIKQLNVSIVNTRDANLHLKLSITKGILSNAIVVKVTENNMLPVTYDLTSDLLDRIDIVVSNGILSIRILPTILYKLNVVNKHNLYRIKYTVGAHVVCKEGVTLPAIDFTLGK